MFREPVKVSNKICFMKENGTFNSSGTVCTLYTVIMRHAKHNKTGTHIFNVFCTFDCIICEWYNAGGTRTYVTNLGGNMARFTQFPIMITRSTIIYEIISPGAAGSSIYV